MGAEDTCSNHVLPDFFFDGLDFLLEVLLTFTDAGGGASNCGDGNRVEFSAGFLVLNCLLCHIINGIKLSKKKRAPKKITKMSKSPRATLVELLK